MSAPHRGAIEVLDDLGATTVRPTGVYDAVCANGLVTASNRRYSRKDFVNAQKYFFSNAPALEKSRDKLNVSMVDEFKPDGTIRLDRIVGQVLNLQVVDNPVTETWELVVRFAMLDVNERMNPWFPTMMPLLMKLHGFYKAIPCGKGDVELVDGVEMVHNFQLRYILLSCGTNFQNVGLVQPVFMANASNRPQSGAINTHQTPQRVNSKQIIGDIFGRAGGGRTPQNKNIFDARPLRSRLRGRTLPQFHGGTPLK